MNFENVSKENNIMKSLELISAQMQKIGFDKNGINYAIEELSVIISKYNNPEEAANIIAENFQKYVKIPFGEKEYKVFLREINPDSVSDHEMEQELGIYDYEINILSLEEKNDYIKERDEFLKLRRKENSENLSVLKNPSVYEILQSIHYRKVQPSEQPDNSKIKFIKTPTGGQPGYKIKKRKR